MNIENFDWGWMDVKQSKTHIYPDGSQVDIGSYHKQCIIDEVFKQKVYERFFEVEEGDVVFDVGASIGPFTYSILDKNPSKVVCIEPSPKEHDSLIKNVTYDSNGELRDNVIVLKTGITKEDNQVIDTFMFGNVESEIRGNNFNTILNENNIEKIDFIKTDCEGGEYEIFTSDKICWIKENVKKISGEWHLGNKKLKNKFKIFRDTYLRIFPNHEVYSVDGVNIKWDLWNDHFLEYYNEVIIYIDNR